MRILSAIVCCLGITVGSNAALNAQTSEEVVALAVVEAEKKATVATAMELGDEEAAAFWPLYDEFQRDLAKLDARLAGVIQDYAKSWRTLDDETAKGLLTEYLDVEEDRVALRRAYLGRFRETLSEVKVLRYYQLENKLQAGVLFGLAESVPLVP